MFRAVQISWNLSNHVVLKKDGPHLYIHDNVMGIWWKINPPVEEMLTRLPHTPDYFVEA